MLPAVLRCSSRFGEIRIVFVILIFDHRVRRAMWKLIGKVAVLVRPGGGASRGFAFNRTFFCVAIVMSCHKSSSMALLWYQVASASEPANARS